MEANLFPHTFPRTPGVRETNIEHGAIMRRSLNSAIILFSLFCVTALQGCLDIATTTVVNRDGSMSRMVIIEGDSASVHARQFPLVMKGIWEEEIERIDDRRHRFTARRDFPDTTALNEAIAGETGLFLPIRISFEQRFEWFSTVYRYAEHHTSFNNFHNPPIHEFLTPSDIEILLQGEADEAEEQSALRDEAEKKIEEWWARNIFEAFFSEFQSGVENLSSPSRTPESIAAQKDELFRASRGELSSGSFETIQEIFEKAFGRNLVREAMNANREGFHAFRERFTFQQGMLQNSFRASAEMPGTIIGTNATTVEGNLVTWEDFLMQGIISDYELWVESREVNWWMIYLTGIGVILALLLLMIPLFWKRGLTIPRKVG